MLLEFLTLAGLVGIAIIGLTALAIAGASDSTVATTLADVVKVIGGALIALAYAARGQSPPK
jgi:hypothetical protein